MVNRGAFPVATIGPDLAVERELLEAPSDEPTILGGFHGPCIDLPPRRPSLVELLDWWCDAVWGAES